MDLDAVFSILRTALIFGLSRVVWSYFLDVPIPPLATCLLAAFAVWASHACALFLYHEERMNRRLEETAKLPPRYPEIIPFIGNILSLAWDRRSFLRRLGRYQGKLVSTRVSILGYELFVIQDRETVRLLAKDLNVASPMAVFTYVLAFLFGISTKSLEPYRLDDSGPLTRPYPGSNVAPEDRIHHKLRRGFLQSMSGKGLVPTTQRFNDALQSGLAKANISEEGLEIGDFYHWFWCLFTDSVLNAVTGPAFLKQNPDFVEQLFGFDDVVPVLAQGLPTFLLPKAQRLRRALRRQLKNWYACARPGAAAHMHGMQKPGSWDPFGASELIGYRHGILSQAGHDEDDISATDLGLLWTSSNATGPLSMLALLHIFRDPDLLRRTREEIKNVVGERPVQSTDVKDLAKSPLLSSIYAEILRLYVKVFFIFTAPQSDISLGKWLFPKGRLGLLNTEMCHMDENFWNTRNGEHPVDTFWAERFIIDPADPLSGPIRPDHPERKIALRSEEGDGSGKPWFSTSGLDGAWLPYGGGADICPGRFMAKIMLLLSIALVTHEYDLELLTDRFELDTWRYGFLGRPKFSIPVRIKKRA